VLTWGGMRGVLSLAAAFSVPYTLSNGTAFVQRSMIIYLTFCLIVTSLVLQGLSMPWLIRLMAIGGTNEDEVEERRARRRLVEDALRYLNRRRVQDRYEPGVVRELQSTYERRLHALPAEDVEEVEGFSRMQRDALLLEVLQVGVNEIPGMLAEPAPSVEFEPGFVDAGMGFTANFQVSEFANQGPVRKELRRRVLRRFRAEGIAIPYPTRTVYLRGAAEKSEMEVQDNKES